MPRTVRFLLSMGFKEDMVVELAQAAWGRAWERLGQLRDESRMLSWVNTIALNEARRSLRRLRCLTAFQPSHQPAVTLNEAAIDLAKLFDRCEPGDREILEAQLEGASSVELAAQKGISDTAMRLRSFRARRAAKRLCEGSKRTGILQPQQVALDARRFRESASASDQPTRSAA